MKLSTWLGTALLGATLLSVPATVNAATFDLQLGDYNNFSPYMRELIETSLEMDGHTVNVEILPKEYRIRRIIKEVNKGTLAILWTGKGRKFAEKPNMLTVDIGLTEGLKAKQVLFIKEGTQADYDQVKTLEDFRTLGKHGVFGTGWAAIKYWEDNQLPYMTIDGASTKSITRMSLKGNRGFDYFSRGVLSSPKLMQQNPGLVLEKNLIIEFEDDFILYLNKEQRELRDALQVALEKAQQNGHINKLMRKHYPDTFDQGVLNFDNRIRIKLDKAS